MLWKRIRNDQHSDESSPIHCRPYNGTVGIHELFSSVGAVGWAFNGMNR